MRLEASLQRGKKEIAFCSPLRSERRHFPHLPLSLPYLACGVVSGKADRKSLSLSPFPLLGDSLCLGEQQLFCPVLQAWNVNPDPSTYHPLYKGTGSCWVLLAPARTSPPTANGLRFCLEGPDQLEPFFPGLVFPGHDGRMSFL